MGKFNPMHEVAESPSRIPIHARTSMADALFTTSQQRVLSLLFGQPERSFFTKELIDLAGGGRGAVQRELARLQESGLILQTKVGNQKHYQANPETPIFGELHAIGVVFYNLVLSGVLVGLIN